MKVLLINDSTSDPNWGDRAAAVSLRTMITGVGAEITAAVSEHDLKSSTFFTESFLPEDNPETRTRALIRLFTPPIFLRFRRKIVADPNLTAANRLIPQEWDAFDKHAGVVLRDDGSWRDLIRTVDTVDAVVIHGDGAMVDNGVVPRTDLFLTYLIKKYCGKPVIIVNHTADFNHPALRRMAENVYPMFDDVVFRDPMSAQLCKSFCEGRFAADSAFLFEPIAREQWTPVAGRATYFDVWPDFAAFDPSEPYLCIGGSSKFSFEKQPYPIRRGFVALIKRLQSVYKGQIVLTASDTTDQAMFRPIARELALPLVGVSTPVQQAVDILGHADAYVGGRWHPGIFAVRGGCPIIPILSKTFKMQELARMVGLPERMFDVFALDDEKDAIRERLASLLDMGEGLRRTIAMRAEELSANSWDNVRYVGDHGVCRSERRAAQ